MDTEKLTTSTESSSVKSCDSAPEIGSDKVKNKPGRKPCKDEPMTKRLAQNRQAQRNFRERKENHLRELEERIQTLQMNEMKTRNSLQQLHQENLELKVENRYLRATLSANQLRTPNSSSTLSSFNSVNYSNGNGSEDNLLNILNQKLAAEKKEMGNPSPSSYSDIFNTENNHKNINLHIYDEPNFNSDFKYSAEFNNAIFRNPPAKPHQGTNEPPTNKFPSLNPLTLPNFSPSLKHNNIRLPGVSSLTRGMPSSTVAERRSY